MANDVEHLVVSLLAIYTGSFGEKSVLFSSFVICVSLLSYRIANPQKLIF